MNFERKCGNEEEVVRTGFMHIPVRLEGKQKRGNTYIKTSVSSQKKTSVYDSMERQALVQNVKRARFEHFSKRCQDSGEEIHY